MLVMKCQGMALSRVKILILPGAGMPPALRPENLATLALKLSVNGHIFLGSKMNKVSHCTEWYSTVVSCIRNQASNALRVG